MIRLPQLIPAVAAAVVLSACTSGAPPGATLPALTTSTTATESTGNGSGTTSTTTPPVTGEPTTTEGAPSEPSATAPVDVTVPPEASALPLPTEQVNIPADNAQEEADRAAIEAVWRQVWDLYVRIDAMPEPERRPAVDALVVGALADELIAVGRESNQNGVTSYGTPVLYPYWYRPIGDSDLAVIGDCRDTSAFGDQKVDSGERTTVGVRGSNTVGQFVRQNGQWKLWGLTYLDAVPCKVP